MYNDDSFFPAVWRKLRIWSHLLKKSLIENFVKWDVNRAYIKHPGHLLNVLCMFNLRPVLREFTLFQCLFYFNFNVSMLQNSRKVQKSKWMDWFLYDRDLRHDKVKVSTRHQWRCIANIEFYAGLNSNYIFQ